MKIGIPQLSLVVLIGPSGSGKSTFARTHFLPTEVVSSDACRGLVGDNPNDQTTTKAAFELLHFLAGKRLALGRLTVIDATSVRMEDRRTLVALARAHHVLPVAIVFDLPAAVCQARNADRPDRDFGPHVVRNQSRELHHGLRRLRNEGFRHVTVLESEAAVADVTIEREPLWTDKRSEHGPFDLIGDVHGCFEELCTLLAALGWVVEPNPDTPSARHPDRRKAVLVGDLVDRGPASPAVLRLVMQMVAAGEALCVIGNHDAKLLKKLRGRDVKLTHGLAETMAQLDALADPEATELRARIAAFLDARVSHYVLDDGRLVVAHAGLREELQGRASARVREFAMFGETTGETDEYGLPVRYPWASEYRGKAHVVYGHTPVPEATWLNRTICIDTGCVFGGKLTALRWPEKELVSVPAKKMHYAPARPLVAMPAVPSRAYADLLDIDDVLGKRIIATRIHHTVTIREENTVAALEAMSRFAVDPHWLIYLPPTMAPTETCSDGPWLEHPREAFALFQRDGVTRVVCEEKHMGSRAVIVVCRDEEVARRRFGVGDGTAGVIFSRTGRRFFASSDTTEAVLARIRAAIDRSDLWTRLATDWLCLDAEIMPWSAKAQELLRLQYAPTGSAGRAALVAASAALTQAAERCPEAHPLRARMEERRDAMDRYVASYRRYCWPVDSVADLRIAPFHILASESGAHVDRDHEWHLATTAALCAADEELLLMTAHRWLDPGAEDQVRTGIAWWEELTERGGEGMVVKPVDFVTRGPRGVVQPALKCRGREYLRIIYGPTYTSTDQLERLRERGVGRKRSLALREFALGVEALHRFVEREPLHRVHECVFGVLALESEPVDPRL